MSEKICRQCGHPAIMHGTPALRCELCAACPGLHAPAPAPRRAGYLWEIVEDRCRVCDTYLGDAPRFVHASVCTDCARASEH